MTTRKALFITMVLIVSATAGFLLTPSRTRPSVPDRTRDLKEAEDPFADMVQEGDGLLAQRKAEAAAKERERVRG